MTTGKLDWGRVRPGYWVAVADVRTDYEAVKSPRTGRWTARRLRGGVVRTFSTCLPTLTAAQHECWWEHTHAVRVAVDRDLDLALRRSRRVSRT